MPEEPIIEFPVDRLSTDDPTSSKRCHIARCGREAYPKSQFRDWDVRYHDGRGSLYVIDVQMDSSRMFRLDEDASDWLKRAHHRLLPDDDEGMTLQVYPSDEYMGMRRKLPGPLPLAVKKARAKTRLVSQHQVFKTTGKAKPAKGQAKGKKPNARWVPLPVDEQTASRGSAA